MEHDPSGGLPIEIPILADIALKCRAYAKALHYKEREYAMGISHSCVESLISINGKLDLPGTSNASVANDICVSNDGLIPFRGGSWSFEGREYW